MTRTTLSILLVLAIAFVPAPVRAAADTTGVRVSREESIRHYLQGRWLEEEGDAEGAAAELSRVLMLEPRAVGVLLRIAEAASRAGQPARVRELTARVLAIEPDNARALWLDGAAMFQQDKAAESLVPLGRAAALDSLDADYQRTLARAAETADRPDVAERAWSRAVRLDGDDAEGWFQLSTLWARSGRFADADSALEIASELNPARPGSLFLRGYIRENLGDFDTAIAAYQHHLGIHTDDQGTRRRLVGLLARAGRTAAAYDEARTVSRARPHDADAIQAEATLAFELKRNDEGRRALERMRALDPQDPGLVMRSITTLTRADRNADAVELGRRWAATHGGDPRSRLIAARAYAMAGRLDSAAAVARREIAATPDSTEPRRLLARILQDQKRWPEAIAEWRALRERVGDDPALLLDLAVCLEQSGDVEAAERTGREALQLVPDAAPVLNFVGYLLADHERDLVEAEELIHRALLQEPDNGAYVDSWGWVLFRLGRSEEARRALERAVELTEGDPVVHEHLGDVYARLGLADLARRQYRASLAAESPNPRVRSKLDALK
ncbi:MAG: tetratricopeptide repeat protein [Candidatus Eisenbacteria bacterium]